MGSTNLSWRLNVKRHTTKVRNTERLVRAAYFVTRKVAGAADTAILRRLAHGEAVRLPSAHQNIARTVNISIIKES